MRNGTPMQRLRDRRKFSPAPERVAALARRDLEQAVELSAVQVLSVSSEIGSIRTELQAVRTGVDEILERLETPE